MILIDTRIRDGAVEFLLNSDEGDVLQAGILHGQLRFRTGMEKFSVEWKKAPEPPEPKEAAEAVAITRIAIPALDEPLCEVVVQGAENKEAHAIPFEMGSHLARGLWLESAEEVEEAFFRPGSRVKDDETLAFQVDQLLRHGSWEHKTKAPLAVMLAYKAVEGHAPESSLASAHAALQDVLANIELLQPEKEHREDREQIRLSATMALVHVLVMRGAFTEIEPVVDRALDGFRPSSRANPFHHGENRTKLLLLRTAIHAYRGDRSAAKEWAMQTHYAARESLIYLSPNPIVYGIAGRMLETVRCALGDLRVKDVCEHFLRLRQAKPDFDKHIRKQLTAYLKSYRKGADGGLRKRSAVATGKQEQQ